MSRSAPLPPEALASTIAGLRHSLRTLRRVTFVEAVSYLLLLGIAMPLKYVWDWPWAVRVLGMAHGVLFLWMLWLLLRAWFEAGWPLARVLLVFVASLVPVWPFLLDRRMATWVGESGGGRHA